MKNNSKASVPMGLRFPTLGLKMKLTTFFLLITLFSVEANTYSQKVKITLDMESALLMDVFNEIESQSEFKFLGNKNIIDANLSVTIHVKKMAISNVLNILLEDTQLEYVIIDRQIILRKRKNIVSGVPVKILSHESKKDVVQEFMVSGKVTDANGMPLPGANIVERGTTSGVMTDFDGNYAIELSNNQVVIVVSYLGFAGKEVSINGQTTLNIILEESAAGLDEVVVVGYGTQKKRDLTGAVVSVREEDFSPGANYSAAQLLNGAAAGVAVSQTSSAPGASLKVQVRGAGSINSSNDVLFVIDGLPGVDPSSLSPGDIESMEVLKDASAAAIYGTRAANGVVLITTKKGKEGKSTLTYSTYTGIQSATKMINVLGAKDYMGLINLRQSGIPIFSPSDIASAGAGTDWQDLLFRDAMVQNHQIGLSGGHDKGNYYIGLNYFDQDGIVKNTSNNKYNVRINLQSNPLERLMVKANINLTRESTKAPLLSIGSNENAGPLNSSIQFDPTLPSGLDENGRYYLNSSIALDNPMALIEGITDNTISTRLYGSLSTEYKFTDHVTATVRLGGEINNSRNDFYRDRQTIEGLATNGIGRITSMEYTHWMAEYLLGYENQFSEKHDFSLLGGATYEVFDERIVEAGSGDFLSDVTGTDLIQSGDGDGLDEVVSGRIKNQLNGFLGRMTYGYDNRYLFTASFRVDGSSRFSDDSKYGFFPSGSLGWRISEENFMKDLFFINDLKLRIGYGQLGNQGINNFETRATLIAGENVIFGDKVIRGAVPARLPNPDLKWETTEELNVGLDFGLVRNRISGSIDYFDRTTSDQLFIQPLPSVIGFSSVRTNLGKVRNSGVDFSLRSTNILNDKFSWNTAINLSYLKNEVTQLPQDQQELLGGEVVGGFITQYTIVREGSALQSYFGYEVNGIFQEGDDISNSATPSPGYTAGMPRFVDHNNDGNIDADDRVVLGDPFPDFSVGFNNNFKYKNLFLDMYWVGVLGIETLDANVLESIYPTNGLRNSLSKYYLDRWTPENPSSNLPSGIDPNLYSGGFAINSLTVSDASFARLKNVTLGYDFPSPEKIGLSSLRIFISADNLLTITDYQGYDPEASATGNGVGKVSYNTYPLARTFRLGLNVEF
ncbi:MAG: TonB-dependent receptor [Sediminicola sp.]